MDIDRLKHSIGVARKIVEIGKEYSLNEADLQKLYILDYNHDIGYEFSEDKLEHNIIDGNLLKDNGYEYWKEVYYQLGRNEKTPLSDDEFLRAHWITYFAYSRRKGDDYIHFLLNKFSAKNIFEKKTVVA